jgi:hypothetical protein
MKNFNLTPELNQLAQEFNKAQKEYFDYKKWDGDKSQKYFKKLVNDYYDSKQALTESVYNHNKNESVEFISWNDLIETIESKSTETIDDLPVWF